MLLTASITSAAATGDDANVFLYVVVIIIAVALVVFLGFKDKFMKPKDGDGAKEEKPADQAEESAASEKEDA